MNGLDFAKDAKLSVVKEAVKKIFEDNEIEEVTCQKFSEKYNYHLSILYNNATNWYDNCIREIGMYLFFMVIL